VVERDRERDRGVCVGDTAPYKYPAPRPPPHPRFTLTFERVGQIRHLRYWRVTLRALIQSHETRREHHGQVVQRHVRAVRVLRHRVQRVQQQCEECALTCEREKGGVCECATLLSRVRGATYQVPAVPPRWAVWRSTRPRPARPGPATPRAVRSSARALAALCGGGGELDESHSCTYMAVYHSYR
jgi:hypothetical protein